MGLGSNSLGAILGSVPVAIKLQEQVKSHMSDLANSNHTTESEGDLDQPQLTEDGKNGANTAFERWLIEYRRRLAAVHEEDTKRTADD
jgi:hypothetical protein